MKTSIGGEQVISQRRRTKTFVLYALATVFEKHLRLLHRMVQCDGVKNTRSTAVTRSIASAQDISQLG